MWIRHESLDVASANLCRPMVLDPLLRHHQPRIRDIARRHGVTSVRAFGSRARGDAKPESDVDLLIEAPEQPAFFFPGGLIADLEALLGTRVEVVTEAALHPTLRERVLREAVPL